jgi:hypothetical protein
VAIRNPVVGDGELLLPSSPIGELGNIFGWRTFADAICGELIATSQVEDVAADSEGGGKDVPPARATSMLLA